MHPPGSAAAPLLLAMPRAAEAALLGVLVIATAVWVGGLVTIVVVARVAARVLGTAERITFFRGLGRAYGLVGGAALLAALSAGAILVAGRPWDGLLTAAAAVAGALVAATAAGIAQARWMTRLRRSALQHPGDATVAGQVRRGARSAAALRAVIGALSLALIALGSLLAT